MRFLLLLPVASWATPAGACTDCRPLVEARLLAEALWPAAMATPLPALLLGLAAWLAHRTGSRR